MQQQQQKSPDFQEVERFHYRGVLIIIYLYETGKYGYQTDYGSGGGRFPTKSQAEQAAIARITNAKRGNG